MKRDYKRLPIEKFGRLLIATGDLDPIYIALTRCPMHTNKLKRWLVAYWCFYSAGVASFMSHYRGEEYWYWMCRAAKNDPDHATPYGGRWPRGHERRHFRAANAMESLSDLMSRYGDKPEKFVDYVSKPANKKNSLTCTVVTERVQEHVGFGPWIGFKVADMVDRVLKIPVSFSTAAIHIFDDPKKGAEMLFKEKKGESELSQQNKLAWALHFLEGTFADMKAPPFEDRPIGLQEAETILCKWKSHMNGHYPIGNDLTEIHEGLKPWLEYSKEAKGFKAAMPPEAML